jgi:hypothetical protein
MQQTLNAVHHILHIISTFSDFLAILEVETGKFPYLEMYPKSCILHSEHSSDFLAIF